MSNQAESDSRRALREAAKALGRLGGLKGGPARKAALTPEQRSAAAKKAVDARWAKERAKIQGPAKSDAGARWMKDVRERVESLALFAERIKATLQSRRFVWSNGRYVLLHFDLITISPDGEVDRSETYKAIGEMIAANNGMKLSESVYLLALLKGRSPKYTAAVYWNRLGDSLAGGLLNGDKFFLHFDPGLSGLLGAIAEVVGEDRALGRAKISPDL